MATPAADVGIEFYEEEGGTLPADLDALRDWIERVLTARGGRLGALNYIFCGDDYLHRLNVKYLQHDTLTDIITFPYAHFPEVSGDLFISTERTAENALEHGTEAAEELHRVMAHGVLHLCGQGDKTEAEAAEMRRLEEWALSLR